MKDVVIVSGVRLPVGSYGGSLKSISAIDMGAMVVKEAVNRAGIQPSDVDEVIIGQVGQIAENGFVARAISLKAGMPKETTAYSVNRQCGSSLQSIADAVMEIQTGQADVVVAGGAENISQLPYYVKDARWGARMGHKTFEDGVIDILTWPLDGKHNGVTAENVASKYNVTREEQDEFALESHQRAVAAIKAGKFKDEILPVELKDRKGNVTVFDTDEGPREGQTLEKLAKLRPCFVKGGTVTAGNSSSLNDGAAAVVIMSADKAKELGVTPKLKIVDFAVAGFDAELMGYSPKFSSEKLASKLDINLKDIDMFEINEAFASQAYAVRRDLGLDKDNSKVIVCHLGNGSSISAVQNGKCVDTTMGLTPLEGVVMGTRSGSIDPAIVEYIAKKENLDLAGVMNVLNKKSGLQGMSGVSSDMRDLRAAAAEGNEDAKNAIEVLCYGIAKYVGGYVAAMNGVDAIVFTAGIGENVGMIREKVCSYLGFLGVTIDAKANEAMGEEVVISGADSKVKVAVIPTNEELAICRDTVALVK